MKNNAFKGVISATLAGMAVYFNALIIPIVILILVMLADYLTGIAAAWFSCELSSRTGIKGIIKKLLYLIVVCMGITIDWILKSAFGQFGLSININYIFGLIITIWLIINEVISILENVSKVGVPLPSFLNIIIRKLKITVEKQVNIDDETDSL